MKEPASFVLRNAGRLVTCDPQRVDVLGVVENSALAARDGRIVWLGRDSEVNGTIELSADGAELDAGGRAVLPGLIDAHTHLVFAGDRVREFASRMHGQKYTGGGIASTMQATSEASTELLKLDARERLDRFAAFGATTVEAKTGYGLDAAGELRLLDVICTLGHAVDVVPTALAAHVTPPGRTADDWIDEMIEVFLPQAKDKARFCDAWCDEGAFSPSQCRRLLTAARLHGFGLKLHAEQLSHIGGALLAATLGCASADHLEFANEEDALSLAAAGTVAVLLPGASMMTRSRFAPARMLIDNGVRVALSTDFNPGSSYSENLQLMVALGCAQLKMTVEEAILGVTRHAAQAIGMNSIGVLRVGAACNLVVLAARSEIELAYHYGVNLAASVVKGGAILPM